MRLSRFQPYNPIFGQLQQLQSEMNRLFQRWGDDGGELGLQRQYPLLNVWEDGAALHVEAELPGLELKDLEIYVTGDNQLSIKGQRREQQLEKGTWHRQERGSGTFARVLTLPSDVDREKVEARFENGILQIVLPKKESAKPRKIQVKGE